MIKSLLLLLVFLISVLGCGESRPELAINDLQVVAAAPGRKATVAYLSINNQGGSPAVLTGASSPQFKRVEFHETVVNDGIARMQALSAVTIDANRSIEFAPGARHLMLLEPVKLLLPGDEVTLQFYFESGAIVVAASPLATRIKLDSGDNS